VTATVSSGTLRWFKGQARSSARRASKAAMLRCCFVVVGAWFTLNWVYQVVRKPAEILAPVGDSLAKSPSFTWQSYGPLFEKYSTKIISPEFLAALAQVEGSGNPIASTYWRWRWSWHPFDIYRPASTAVGMFQITDGTFAEARKYCIRDHQVIADGTWHDLNSCWFNSFYSRTMPSHSIQLTAAYLHQTVVHTLAARPSTKSTPAQQQRLAAVIHLCGSKRGEAFAKRAFKLAQYERCGTHNVARYLARIDLMKRRFVELRMARS
jgi:hypothetical protein